MKWTIHIEGGPRRVNHAAVCIDDKIYSFGGYCSTEEYKDWDPIPVHVLDTNTLRWSAVAYKDNEVKPFQRYGHTTVAYKNIVSMKYCVILYDVQFIRLRHSINVSYLLKANSITQIF